MTLEIPPLQKNLKKFYEDKRQDLKDATTKNLFKKFCHLIF